MILSKSDLREAARQAKSERLEKSYIIESMNFDSLETYDLFISHSFKDHDLVIGLKYRFDKLGYKVYVDWIDDKELDRTNVTPKTAEIIKQRISRCSGLAYVATQNISSSKWCPWELGVSDGMNGRVCILPVTETGTFHGQEYLGMYPYLEFDHSFVSNDICVMDQSSSYAYASLRDWLNGAGFNMNLWRVRD